MDGILWDGGAAARGLAGGLAIGLAAALLLLANGRVMGASGLMGGLIDGTGDARAERGAFLAGLVGAPALAVLALGAPPTNVAPAPLLLVGAGLLVGVGTRLGAGCTSGHGVCGMSRLSLRSILATAVFVAVGVLTVRAFG